MAITHLLLAQKTHEQGQKLNRERKIGCRESKQPASSIAASIKLQASQLHYCSEIFPGCYIVRENKERRKGCPELLT